MDKSSKMFLSVSASIMLIYFCVQCMILLGIILPSYNTALFGMICLIVFTPPFFMFSRKYYIDLNQKKKSYQDKMEAISKSSMIVIFDPKGKIKEVNENFISISKRSIEQLIGKRYSEISAEQETDEKYIWNKIINLEHVEGVFEISTPDGDSIWLQSFYSPVVEKSKLQEVILIAHDASFDYKSQIDLINKNKYLEHSAKILRHDMHSGINTYIPRGIRSLERRLSPDQIKSLKIETPLKLIKDGLRHTQRVYEGIKAFTNIVKENSSLETELCNLEEILNEYFADTAYSDQIAIGRLPTIKVNKSLFCTAIDNLVRNGIKYNDSDFKMVAITMYDEEHIAVIDNGRGMSSEEFKNLSRPYYRKENQLESGTGLGLNITVAILKEHGFDISIEKQEVGTLIKIRVII